MNVTVETYGQSIVLNCKGELTADSLDAFRNAVEHQLTEDQVRDLVLNFEQVPFVDSAGLEYLMELQEKLSERLGQVKLARLDENVSKIMEITRLDSAFDRFDDINQAVKAM
ncbi:MAG TPA: STAS domain-containing protein [Phycisphaerae bacterium]|nr:STAS domain-containing protein [Phycisphaerae bacterium]